MERERKRCPRCEEEYTGTPALSRANNMTDICSDCGLKEALEAFLAWEHIGLPPPP